MNALRILVVTSEWPTAERPSDVPFIVRQVEGLRRLGLQVDVFSFRGNQNPFNYAKSWLGLRRQHTISDYDLIHAHFGQSGLVALPARAPLVVTFHGSDLEGIVGANGKYNLAGYVLRLVSRLVARRATRVIVVSKHLSRHLPRKLCYDALPCGIDTNLFTPLPQANCRARLGLSQNKRLVLFSGDSSNPVKRYHLAREAVMLLERERDVELVVMRDVPHREVVLYLNACDLLLSTSLHEGSPTIIKEALACNVPVVTVNAGDVEYLSAIRGCVLCADSPRAIACGIVGALDAGRLAEGREAALRFDERLVHARLLAIYQAVVRATGKRTIEPLSEY